MNGLRLAERRDSLRISEEQTKHLLVLVMRICPSVKLDHISEGEMGRRSETRRRKNEQSSRHDPVDHHSSSLLWKHVDEVGAEDSSVRLII